MQYVFRMRRPCDLGRMYETSCPPKATPDPSDSLSRPPGTCCRAIALDLTGRWLRAELKTVCRSGDINCYMREVFLARKSKTNAKISSTGRYRHCQQSAERQDIPCGGPSCDDIVGAPGECFSSNRVRRTDWRCRSCNRLRYSSEGGYLHPGAMFRAFGNLPRPESWLP